MSANSKLEALRALFKKEKDIKANGGSNRRSDMYPFWNMQLNQKAVVRILPDKNPENPYVFFVDKLEHILSIDGNNERVPCLQMYGEKCPICDLSREFYKAEGSDSISGKSYYRKKTSILRLLIVEDPLPPDEETGENSVGKVLNSQFGYQLMEKIKEEIGSDELESSPWDLNDGYNFIIKKTPQGEYGTYAIGSGFARKATPIPPELVDTIELIDLQTLLPKNPGYEYVKRKLDSHLNGTDHTDSAHNAESEHEPVSESKSAATKPSKPVPAANDDDDDDDDDDILAQIRRDRLK